MNERDFTTRDAAKLASISQRQMQRLLKQGVIANRGRRGIGRYWLVDEASLKNWVAQRRRKGGA